MPSVRYHPFSDAVIDDPFPVYRELRDEAPALYLEEFDCWFLSRFEDIWNTLEKADALSNLAGTTTNELLLNSEGFTREPSMMLSNIDRPHHTQIRRAIMKYFLPNAAAKLEDTARENVRASLDAVYDRGEACAVHDIAMRLSVRIALTIIGIPLEAADPIVAHVNAFFDRKDGARGATEASQQANAALFALLTEWLQSEEKDPRSPLLKDLTSAVTDDGPLTFNDLLFTLQLLVVGGTETLPKVVAGTLHRLWQNPEQRRRVVADPTLAKDAFWEGLRYDMPTNMLGRTIASDLELHGESLRKGQKVMFLWHCANHDEREFPDPERFDIDRKARRILSFGHAVHRCLGANVAQMEGRVLVEEILARIPEYEVDEAAAVRLRSEFFQGWASLPIRWQPR